MAVEVEISQVACCHHELLSGRRRLLDPASVARQDFIK